MWLSKKAEPEEAEEHDAPSKESAESLAPSRSAAANSPKSELRNALSACRSALVSMGFLTAAINVLTLTGSIFMLEVYDRVLPSRSIPTLVGLAILTGFLLSIQGILDLVRSRLLVRIGSHLDVALSRRVFTSLVRLPALVSNHSDGLQPVRDLDSVRSFLSGMGPAALFDLPWIAVYLYIIFAFHPSLGLVALFGAIVLIGLTLLTEMLTRGPARLAASSTMERYGLAEAGVRNSEVLVSMGMTERMADRWETANEAYIHSQKRASDVTNGFGSISKVFRVMLQSAVLGVGAYLVINQEATAGIIIAGSILTARAFAPVDMAISQWKGLVAARDAWRRLENLLRALPEGSERLPLPTPKASITIDTVSVAPPGADRLVVSDVSFSLKAGQGLGIIGPSAAGKSSLARLLVGIWHPARGKVRLDGAALDQWDETALGKHIGYLPQDVELFAGTIAQNIARFDRKADPKMVVTAAQAAGVHELIVHLKDGYDTEIGAQGLGLSAGQKQRVGLARALYGDPFLVVLDEPNSNLDASGEVALSQAILSVRRRGGIIVVVSHRYSALAGVDTLLVMNQGRAQGFGPKEEVLSKVTQTSSQLLPLGAVTREGLNS